MSDRNIALLMGVIAGMLLCLIAGLFSIAAGSPAEDVESAQAPAGAVIEAAITEAYVNRAFVQNVASGTGSWSVDDGRIDILPGSRVQFTARIGSPLGKLMVEGAVTMAVKDERLAIRIVDARLGQLPLIGLLKPFLPSIESRIDEEANRQLSERLAQANVRLIGVTSDDTYLRFHLAGQR
jgi:hypothetical protein